MALIVLPNTTAAEDPVTPPTHDDGTPFRLLMHFRGGWQLAFADEWFELLAALRPGYLEHDPDRRWAIRSEVARGARLRRQAVLTVAHEETSPHTTPPTVLVSSDEEDQARAQELEPAAIVWLDPTSDELLVRSLDAAGDVWLLEHTLMQTDDADADADQPAWTEQAEAADVFAGARTRHPLDVERAFPPAEGIDTLETAVAEARRNLHLRWVAAELRDAGSFVEPVPWLPPADAERPPSRAEMVELAALAAELRRRALVLFAVSEQTLASALADARQLGAPWAALATATGLTEDAVHAAASVDGGRAP